MRLQFRAGALFLVIILWTHQMQNAPIRVKRCTDCTTPAPAVCKDPQYTCPTRKPTTTTCPTLPPPKPTCPPLTPAPVSQTPTPRCESSESESESRERADNHRHKRPRFLSRKKHKERRKKIKKKRRKKKKAIESLSYDEESTEEERSREWSPADESRPDSGENVVDKKCPRKDYWKRCY